MSGQSSTRGSAELVGLSGEAGLALRRNIDQLATEMKIFRTWMKTVIPQEVLLTIRNMVHW